MAELDYSYPLKAGELGRQTAQNAMNQFAQQRAGNALANGDYTGATNALYRSGQIGLGLGVQKQGQPDAEDVKARLALMRRASHALRNVPEELRQQAFEQHLLPAFQAVGVPPAELERLRSADKSNASLDMFDSSLSNEEQKWQIMNRRDGSIVAVNQGTLEPRELYPALPASAVQHNVPFGWEVDENGDAHPTDSFVQGKARIAGATRAPPRGRSGGGGGRGGGRPKSYGADEVKW